ncbi:gp53-like domain-containing protein [Escherichia coli]|uniref:gp53-like domain-containing protein n=1 Tax=Escherichia coli TaxID=562 RepID=UPI003D9C7401
MPIWQKLVSVTKWSYCPNVFDECLWADTNGTTGNFPIAFPSGALAVSALWSDGTLTAAPTFKLMGYTTTRTSVTLKVSTGNGLYGTMIIAIGR